MAPGAGRWARRLGTLVALAGGWIIVAEGEVVYAPALAAGAVLVAVVAADYLASRRRFPFRPLGALLFAAHFARLSLIGGIDVARRALRRRPGLRPEVTEVMLEIEGDTPAAALVAASVSLIPGTLCAEAAGRRLTVHVIDRHQDNERHLRDLQRRAAGVFGAPRGEGG